MWVVFSLPKSLSLLLASLELLQLMLLEKSSS